ncbi:MAG: TonB-dependent receptor [Desulfobacterales bacterium]|nr:TonB-dependent receptor [Desulfobacterales bacterium]
MNLQQRKREIQKLLSIMAAIWIILFQPRFADNSFAFSSLSEADNEPDFGELTLEELLNYEITSAAKKPQSVMDTAAAISVITQEDIRRSGASTIPDLLRHMPGLQVAHINTNAWAVSVRGFNQRLSNKLLALMDGRSIYSPLYAGVHWGIQNTLLEDIERIEIIRGPGASLWGANAVNGVINIITKDTFETQDGLVKTGAGSSEKGYGAFRYGGTTEQDIYWKVYAQYLNKDGFKHASGADVGGDLNTLRGGFRMDWSPADQHDFTLQGDACQESMEYGSGENGRVENGNLIFRWQNSPSERSDMKLQLYYDRSEYKYSTYRDESQHLFDTVDIDFQHRFFGGKYHEIVWGAGYRFYDEYLSYKNEYIRFDQDIKNNLFSFFFQDEIGLYDSALSLIIGTKYEYDDFTGDELQPTIRLLWKVTPKQRLWASVSKAVRTPSTMEYSELRTYNDLKAAIIEKDIELIEKNIHSEKLYAWEIGYRAQPSKIFSYDLALFCNHYHNLYERPVYDYDPNRGDDTSVMGTNGKAATYGLEIASKWQIFPWWNLQIMYSFIKIDFDFENEKTMFDKQVVEFGESTSPENQFSLISKLDFDRYELDLSLRYADRLNGYVDNYVELDARIGVKLSKNIELEISGRNLLHKGHAEFLYRGPNSLYSDYYMEVPRSVTGKITWRF